MLAQVPLDNGTDDGTFHRLFKPIMDKVVQVFQPGAIVLQCGAPRPVVKALVGAKLTSRVRSLLYVSCAVCSQLHEDVYREPGLWCAYWPSQA